MTQLSKPRRSPRPTLVPYSINGGLQRVPPTHTRTVESGALTGVYYIPFCNVRFGTTWQEVKDFVAEACVVDHVEVFLNTSTGWIRLTGRENFEKAWEHINSASFQNRMLVASDQNRDEPVVIKDRLPTNHSPETFRPRALDFMSQERVNQGQIGRVTCCCLNSPSTTSSGVPHLQARALASLPPHPIRIFRSHTIGSTIGTTSNETRLEFISDMDAWCYTQSWPTGANVSVRPAGQDSNAVGSGTVPIDSAFANLTTHLDPRKRTIMINNFIPSEHEFQLRAWVAETYGLLAESEIRIGINRRASSGSNPSASRKGYGEAYITFQTASKAAEALELLENHKFRGRPMDMSLIVENNPPQPTPRQLSAEQNRRLHTELYARRLAAIKLSLHDAVDATPDNSDNSGRLTSSLNRANNEETAAANATDAATNTESNSSF